MPDIHVLCWFDTEDALVPEAEEAPLRLAQIFAERKLCATFKLSGAMVRMMEERGCPDLIESLTGHDIGYCSNLHSMHPNPAEYLRDMDWDEGVREFVRREEQGVTDILRVFGRTPCCYGQPGGSWAPQAYGAMRLWGIPAYVSSSAFVSMSGRPFYFCGVLTVSRMQPNQMGIGFDVDRPETLEELKRTFAEDHAALQREGGVISIGAHPAHWVLDGESFDSLNFAAGRNVPRAAWRQPPPKSRERIEAAFRNLAAFLDFATRLEGVRFVGARELAELCADKTPDTPLELTELMLLATTLSDQLSFQQVTGGFLSAAEIFYIVASAIAHFAQNDSLPKRLHPRTITGPVRSCRTEAQAESLSLSDIYDAARSAVAYADYVGRMPSELHTSLGVISPEDFLATAVGALEHLAVRKKPIHVEMRKARLTPVSLVSDELAHAAWRWRIFPPGFSAPKLLDLAKLQAWTLKPA